MRKITLALTIVVGLLLSVVGVAFAWPDQPPDRATISGPGLNGETDITDKDVLAAMKLGVLEELEAPQTEAPQVSGEGYTIRRWFYGGEFNFATLHYYPDPAGGNGYVRWDDGPDLTGDHTPYNGRWLRITERGEAAVQKVLVGLGVSLSARASTSANPVSMNGTPAALAIAAGLGLVVVIAALFLGRRARAAATSR